MKQKNIYIITLSLFLLLTTLNFVVSEEETKGMSLEIIDDNITFYKSNAYGNVEDPLMNPEGYLFEGESMEFRVKVYSSKGIEEIKDVYITANKEIKADCHKERIIDNKNGIWSCTLTAETPESMYGIFDVNLVAESLSEDKVSQNIGTFFLNPEVLVYANPTSFNFQNVSSGNKIYTDFITIENKVSAGSNVSLSFFVSAPNTNKEDKCIRNTLPLNSLYYYAENGEYSTKNDPRADKEGYIQITSTEEWDDHTLKLPLIINKSLVDEGKNMIIKFRINIPKNCDGNYKGQIYLWGKSRYHLGLGEVININLNITKDSIPPEAKIRFNSNIFEVNGFDDKSNVTTTKKTTCLKKNGEICSKELRRFVIKDEAGNDLSLNAIYEKVGGQTKTTISSLKYHGENVDDYNDERIGINWFWLYTFPNFPEKIMQPLKIGNEYVTTYYNPTTNKTRIEIKNKTGSKSYTEEGYNYVELRTDKGKLRYEVKKGVLPIIDQEVYSGLDISERVKVMIVLKDTQIRELNKEIQNNIISSLNENEFNLRYASSTGRWFSGDITKEGLEKLRYNQYIIRIYLPIQGGASDPILPFVESAVYDQLKVNEWVPVIIEVYDKNSIDTILSTTSEDNFRFNRVMEFESSFVGEINSNGLSVLSTNLYVKRIVWDRVAYI